MDVRLLLMKRQVSVASCFVASDLGGVEEVDEAKFKQLVPGAM